MKRNREYYSIILLDNTLLLKMAQHYILRVGNGKNFVNSSHLGIWVVKSKNKTFLASVKEGDILWFVRNKESCDISTGKVIAVVQFVSANKRNIGGPLISITPDNDELGWDEMGGDCDIEIHYNNLYNLTNCSLYTGQNNQTTICAYENVKERLLVNLIVEYEYIVRYSNITHKM